MPQTKKGKKIESAMEKEYGTERGKRIYYASIVKGKIMGSLSGTPWHTISSAILVNAETAEEIGFIPILYISNERLKEELFPKLKTANV